MGFVLQSDSGGIDPGVWAGSYDVINMAQSDLLLEMADFTSIGVNPIAVPDLEAGVDYMVDRLCERVGTEGNMYLLRIHGHGLAGLQTVSCGMTLKRDKLSGLRSVISTYNFETIQRSLSRLSGLFASDGEVWLMGCNVAENPLGPILLSRLAKLWGVPVRGGTGTTRGRQ